jgi:hypothetical protein
MNKMRFAGACCAPLALWACNSSSGGGPADGGTGDGGGTLDGTSMDSTVTNDGGREAAPDSGSGDAASSDGGSIDGGSGDAAADGGAADVGAGGDSGAEAGVPVVLATGFDVGNSITSDGTSVFFFAANWHDDGGLVQETRLVQVPVGGGPLTTRFTYSGGNPQGGTPEPGGGITVDGTNLFFCGSAHAWRMPIAGGNPVDLMPTSAPPMGFFGCGIPVVDAVNLYSGADSNDPTIFSVPKIGGTPSYFAGPDLPNTAAIGGYPMASDGTYVYWVPFSGAYSHTMQRALGTGGATETFVAAPDPDAGALQYLGFVTSNLVFTGGDLYWMEFATGFAPTYLWKVPTSGGTPTVVAQGNYFYEGIATDGAFIYWFEGLNGIYSVKKTSVAGGGPVTTVVADAISISGGPGPGPELFTVDSTNVYWFDPPNLYKATK